MTQIVNPIALRALEKALHAARRGPEPRKKVSSRVADKFVIRGFKELFSELAAIGQHHGRSANSEMVAAVLEELAGHERASALIRILHANLGLEVGQMVLETVPTFQLEACIEKDRFVIRLPPQVRERVRDGVRQALQSNDGMPRKSMNDWVLQALVTWVRYQRQQFALLSAAISLEQSHTQIARPTPEPV